MLTRVSSAAGERFGFRDVIKLGEEKKSQVLLDEKRLLLDFVQLGFLYQIDKSSSDDLMA